MLREGKTWVMAGLSLLGCSEPGSSPEGETEVGEVGTGMPTSTSALTSGASSSSSATSGATSSDAATETESSESGSDSESGSTTSGDAPPPPCTEGESVIGPIAEAMAPGEWREITDVFPANPENFYDMGSPIFAFTDEGQWDSVRRRVFFIGQGHHSNNDEDPSTAARFYAYHECANAWQQLPDIITNPGAPTAGNIGHQYDHSALDEERGLFFHAPYNTKALYVYDIEAGQWSIQDQPEEFHAPISYDITQGIEFFPALGVVWFTSAWGVSAFDPETSEWSSLGAFVGTDTYHEVARYSPAHDSMLLGGGNGSQEMFRLESDGSVVPVSSAPAPFGISNSQGFLAAPNGDMVLLDVSGSLWTYDIPSDAWAEHSDIPVALTDGYQITVSLDTHGVMLLVSFDQGAWLYRHG